MIIRQATAEDWDAIWDMLAPVFNQGETYTYPAGLSKVEAHYYWIEKPKYTYVAVEAGKILGTYFLTENQPGQGSHVCNCGYVVAASARKRGIASAMCIHSQEEAIAKGFKAMQYNIVVKTNEGAVRLWQKHGFEIVGTLPKAYKHSRLGYVDAHVMYKLLDSSI